MSGVFVSKRNRQPGKDTDLPVDDVQVAVAEPGTADLDDDLSWTGLWNRDVFDDEGLAVGMQSRSFHKEPRSASVQGQRHLDADVSPELIAPILGNV